MTLRRALRHRISSRMCSLLGLLGLLALVGLSGCDVDSTGISPLPTPSRSDFAAEAGPILTERCSDYACHGNDVQPFALYAVSRRRLKPEDRFTSHPLSLDEVDANFHATLGFLNADRARDTTLIRKALGIGGTGGHRGGAVFEAPSDPRCRALMRWIDGDQL